MSETSYGVSDGSVTDGSGANTSVGPCEEACPGPGEPREGSKERSWAGLGASLGAVFDFFFPAPCASCRRPLEEPGLQPGLCAECLLLLKPAPQNYCPHCGTSRWADGAEMAPCGACRRRRPPIDQLFWGWSYEPPLDAAVMAYKLSRLDYLGDRWGRQLAFEVGDRLPPFDGITPVPLHFTRRLRRGFDQADVLARALAHHLEKPIVPVLRRRRATPSQNRLDRKQRRRNLRGAFALRRGVSIEGSCLLLVDDVTTTGSTFAAAAEVLSRAGCGAVYALALARTPSSPS